MMNSVLSEVRKISDKVYMYVTILLYTFIALFMLIGLLTRVSHLMILLLPKNLTNQGRIYYEPNEAAASGPHQKGPPPKYLNIPTKT